jgi:hypothetical protein
MSAGVSHPRSGDGKNAGLENGPVGREVRAHLLSKLQTVALVVGERPLVAAHDASGHSDRLDDAGAARPPLSKSWQYR